MQRRYIRHVLHMTNGKVSGPGGAAELLGIARTTLNARMKKLGLR
jgi:transcriptional regulator with GAF, ATPase, and Fis domain